MEQSLFFLYVEKYFPQLVLQVIERLNDSARPLSYLHRTLFTPRFSVDGRWATLKGNYTRVTADVVAMDSKIPLIKRDTIETASGYIPKIAVGMALNEKQMSDIDAMIAQGVPETQVARAIFEDTPKVIEAVFERLEYMALLGLSTGYATADSENNVGTETRINYGFLDANRFGVSVAWKGNNATSKPFDDIKRIMDKADEDGHTITRVYADDQWIDDMCMSEQVRSYFVFAINNTAVPSGGVVPILDRAQLASILERKYNIELVRVNRSLRTEKNGKQTSVKPWKTGSATFVCDDVLGDLVWTNVAEATRRVSGVTYETANDYILVSKYRKNDPLQEFTTTQARVVPVISNVDRIYTLDSTEVQA